MIKYDADLLKTMHLFEQVTGAKVVDCFEDEHLKQMVFVVEQGELRKAIGKQGRSVKKLQDLLGKRIKIVEKTDSIEEFVKQMIAPLKADAIEEEMGIVTIMPADTKTRGLLIGRQAQNLRNLERNVQRFFDSVEEIKVTG